MRKQASKEGRKSQIIQQAMKKTQQPNITKRSCKEKYTDDFNGGSRKRLSEREIFELKAGRFKKGTLC